MKTYKLTDKMFSRYKKLGLSFKLFLKFSKFEPQDSHKLYSYKKKCVFKKDNSTDRNNYRPISILPNISNIFERCMYQQISAYFEENISSKYQ